MTRAAIYARVSTGQQEREQTIDAQLAACRAYCQQHDYEIVAEFRDESVSGATPFDERDEGKRLLEAAQQGQFTHTIIYCVDRLGRDVTEGIMAHKELAKAGAPAEFVSQSFDDTPEGEFTFGIFLQVAQLERKVIARRFRLGRERVARDKGQFNCDRTAFGFDTRNKKLVVNPSEADTVRYIYDLYIREGLSHNRLAERLNAEGRATKTNNVHPRSVDGKKKGWTALAVSRILTNPLYKGDAFFNKSGPDRKPRPRDEWIPIDCPAIIDDKTWAAARRRAKKNDRSNQRPKDAITEFLLSGLLRCGHCGGRMYGTSHRRPSGKRDRYLYCGQQKFYHRPCHEHSIRAPVVEAQVFSRIYDLFSDPQRVRDACDAHAEA